MQPRACVMMRPSDYYRVEVFREGLVRHGFKVEPGYVRNPRPHDLLLLWNRNRGCESTAQEFERAGATVLIAENGYVGQPAGGGKFYALARNQHNGAGRWFVGDEQRFPIDDKPWRARGDHVLVLPQRGIGAKGVAMPSAWLKGVLERLKRATDRPVIIRPHPGASKEDPGAQLAGAHCAVTWGSGAGIKAIAAGIPVFHEFPRWIGGSAAALLAGQVESCNTPSRDELWRQISWAQWTLVEIGTGEAFDRLIHEKDDDLFCARSAQINDHRRRHGEGLAYASRL